MIIDRPTWKIATSLKEMEELMIPPDSVKRKLDGVLDSFPSEKGCEVLEEMWLMINGMKLTMKVLL